MPNPTTSEAIQRVLNGYKRLACRKADQRLPVTLIQPDAPPEGQAGRYDQDKTMYWSAFTFFGALPIGEYINPSPKSYTPQPTLSLSDVQLDKDLVRIRLQQSKTDQFSHGYSVRLSATGRTVCPVRAVAKYLHYKEVRGHESAPFFQFASGQFLTRQSIDSTPKMCVRDVPNSHRYSSHSLRIGAATAAAQNGASPQSIQPRWKSACFSSHVRSEVPVIGL
ncbi:hypothetical protein RvY_15714 [Ramazzottius varieornatus]|uniref:Tyr recombinase domain-containing protein n=1 Tax=Ramazzottius varieornatus TaxID=947166 RepID=A0A1D1W2M5_RAMVA|nr:hypothetical protein RvY_15714 [Ramazzottius varieornatus]